MMDLGKHTDTSFDDDLRELRGAVMEMGDLAARMVGDAGQLLSAHEAALADQVIEADRRLDGLRDGIESRAVTIIARRQPVADDLRLIVASMRIAGALERVGDLAKNIAKRSFALEGAGGPRDAALAARRMAERARTSLLDAMQAFRAGDIATADAVWRGDADLDGMLNSLFRELLTYMAENPRAISQGAHLLFCGKNIERIGDHATTIAEAVHFIETGAKVEGERPKVDSVFPETPQHG